MESEIRAAVKDGLKRGRAGGASLFKAEHIKQWLKDMEAAEKAERVGSTGVRG